MQSQCVRLYSAELEGVVARRVEVEVDMHVGLSSFTIVGLADKSVSEARERVSSALKNSHVKPPTRENRRITVNLAPADIQKNGSYYDVAIALGYLLSSGQIASFDPSDKLFVGELALDGSVRRVSGVLSIASMAKEQGIRSLFVPAENAQEAALVEGIRVFGVSTLHKLITHLERSSPLSLVSPSSFNPAPSFGGVDFADIRGQRMAKRACMVAAAGGHNMFFSGPPGAGKTMLARALISILPPLILSEAIAITRVYSAAGLLSDDYVVRSRPFRSPHHSASLVSLVGGGQRPRPGEISLAHGGVLFLDEVPEFRRDVLESLRQPLESGEVIVARAKQVLTFPARFMLIAASNPCPCGFYKDAKRQCVCGIHEIERYQKRLSGPLMDRIDLQLWVDRIDSVDFYSTVAEEGSESMMARVLAARDIQRARYHNLSDNFLNRDLSSRQVNEYIVPSVEVKTIIAKALDKGLLSARGAHRVLKVARTIADLEGQEEVGEDAVNEALSYRVGGGSV